MIRFTVEARPKTQGSLVAIARGVVRHPDGLKTWRRLLALRGHEAMGSCAPLDEPVVLGVLFFLERRRGRRVYPWAQEDGDLDKYLRAVGDALTGVVWKDDARIVGGWQGKLYADHRAPAGAIVFIERLGGNRLLETIRSLIPGA